MHLVESSSAGNQFSLDVLQRRQRGNVLFHVGGVKSLRVTVTSVNK